MLRHKGFKDMLIQVNYLRRLRAAASSSSHSQTGKSLFLISPVPRQCKSNRLQPCDQLQVPADVFPSFRYINVISGSHDPGTEGSMSAVNRITPSVRLRARTGRPSMLTPMQSNESGSAWSWRYTVMLYRRFDVSPLRKGGSP